MTTDTDLFGETIPASRRTCPYCGMPAAWGHTKAALLLNPEGTRVFKLESPPTVTQEELARITSWLSFQLIVAPAPPAGPSN